MTACPVPTTLHDLEIVIEEGRDTFIRVGNALMAIRDGKLYKATHKTFEDYCRQRWGMSKPRAYQLIGAAEVVSNLSTMVDKAEPSNVEECNRCGKLYDASQWDKGRNGTDGCPYCFTKSKITERIARPLTSLPPETQKEVWKEAVETAPEGKVTAKHVESVVKRRTHEPDPAVAELEEQNRLIEEAVTLLKEFGEWFSKFGHTLTQDEVVKVMRMAEEAELLAHKVKIDAMAGYGGILNAQKEAGQ